MKKKHVSNEVAKGQPPSRPLNCWNNSRLGEVDHMLTEVQLKHLNINETLCWY